MISDRRIFVTGHGSVSPLDNSFPAETDFYDELLETSLLADDCAQPTRPIRELHADRYIAHDQLRRVDRLTQMAMISAQKALASAQFSIDRQNEERTGIIFNNCFGPLQSTETYVSKLIREGSKRAPAGLFPYTVVSVLTGLVTMKTKALGTNSTVSGSNSVCYGLDAIRQGTDDVMLVGGCDEITSSLTSWFRHAGYFGTVSDAGQSDSVTPRSSFLFGEGAATLVLEESESMQRRGSQPRAEVLDYGCVHPLRSPHPYHLTPESIEAAMLKALSCSGVQPRQIGLIVSGANGLPQLNHAEDAAVAKLFCNSQPPPAIRVKDYIGETLGSSGVFAVIAAAEALHRRKVPGEASHERAANSFTLGALDAEYALVNCYEFGGNINSIVVKRHESIN